MRPSPCALVAATLLASLASACAVHGAAPAEAVKSVPSPRPTATSSIQLSVAYREAANVFEIVDNLSGWLPDKCDGEYRAYWKERFGVTAADEQRFAAYAEIRKRYYTLPAAEQTTTPKLFAPRKAPDRMAEAFYGAATLTEALDALSAFVTAEDVATLTAIYEAYRPQLAPLLAESRFYAELVPVLEATLGAPPVADHLARLASFYGVREVPTFTTLYVWWPPVEAVTANSRGRFLILKYNPTRHREEALRGVDLPVHELAHWVSQHQSDAQKQALEAVFLARCDVGSVNLAGPRVLEEPLAVVQQKLFLNALDPRRVDFASGWYGDPWIGAFAKLLYPQVKQAFESERSLDEPLMKAAGKTCQQLLALSRSLAPGTTH